MKPSSPTDQQQRIALIIWEHYKRKLAWPSHKTLLKAHPDLETAFERYISRGSDNKEVRLSFEQLVVVPEVKQLLEPLPKLLRIAAQRFLERPMFQFSSDPNLPRIDQEDFSRIWPDREQMTLAHALFDMSPIRVGNTSGRGPDGFHYTCSIDALIYEHVRTLEEALAGSSRMPRPGMGAELSEEHVALMKAVLAHVQEHGRWPTALHFAVEHRDLGFIPNLVNELSGEWAKVPFVRSRFNYTQHNQICLRLWALHFIDPSGELQELLARTVTTLAQMWFDSEEERVVVSLDELSRKLNLGPREVAPAVLLLEDEPWISTDTSRELEEWRARINDSIRPFRAVSNWQDYLKARLRQHGDYSFGSFDRSIPWIAELVGDPIIYEVDINLEPLEFSESSPSGQITKEGTSQAFRTDSEGKAPAGSEELQRFDLAIVCALRAPELEKVLRTGKQEWRKFHSSPDDPHTYYQGTYVTASGTEVRVVAASLTQMGPPAASVLTTKMIFRFQPRLVAMVGIAAGARMDLLGFGDILAPDLVLDYMAGKASDDGGRAVFKPDPQPIHVRSLLISRLKDWQANDHECYKIWKDWQGVSPERPPKLLIGPLASGSSVVAHRPIIDEIFIHWPKLIGLDMEAYAVHFACRDAKNPETPCLTLKSICDFADNSKNDVWQSYAAYTAAELLHRFIIAEWDNLHLP